MFEYLLFLDLPANEEYIPNIRQHQDLIDERTCLSMVEIDSAGQFTITDTPIIHYNCYCRRRYRNTASTTTNTSSTSAILRSMRCVLSVHCDRGRCKLCD